MDTDGHGFSREEKEKVERQKDGVRKMGRGNGTAEVRSQKSEGRGAGAFQTE